ncbi:MAG TPA: sulfotransferase [Rhizomicrobium sp.]|nr:sulfotransferase [Rhizomicrobium sp.]
MQSGTAEKAELTDLDAVIAAAEAGDHARASDLARAALDRGELHPLFLNLRAWWHEANGRLPAALADLEHATALAPDDVPVLNALGLCRERLGRTREALAAFDKATRLAPGFAPAQMNRGRVLEALGESDAARASYESALKLGHNAHPDLAALAARRADWPSARAHAQSALAIRPGLAAAELALAGAELAERDFATAKGRMARLLEGELSALERATVYTLLGDALDGLGDFAAAFAAYESGNALRRGFYAPRYANPAVESMPGYVQRLFRWFEKLPPEHFATTAKDAPGNEDGAAEHVFLVGFARSGTTLLEEVLACHPRVVTTQERDGLSEAVANLFAGDAALDRLASLKGGGLARYRRSYWRALAESGIEAKGKCLIDKQPFHSIALPLLARLFPAAKILYSLRDPRDVVLSAFRRRFQMGPANFQLLTLETAARFYDQVMRLADLYRGRLPLQLRETRHETLIADFDGEARRVCDFIGIPWTDTLFGFAGRAQARAIQTPSGPQIARGLNAEGVGYWRNYRHGLEPVLPILAPWVERFGYPAD